MRRVLAASLQVSRVREVWLIGSSWTVAGDETRQRVKYSDERVCKSHLLNCCPHDILSGTVSRNRELPLLVDTVLCFIWTLLLGGVGVDGWMGA